MSETIRSHYEGRLRELSDELEVQMVWNRRIVWARPILFFPALFLLLAAYTRQDTPSYVMVLGWIIALAFVAVLIWHESVRYALDCAKTRKDLYSRLMARFERRWADISFRVHPDAKLEQCTNASTADLDVFGKRSLYHWMNLASTSIGQRRMAEWITQWQSADRIRERQAAVAELRDQRELREQVLFLANQLSNSHSSPESFTKWASGGSWLQRHRLFHRWSQIGPLLVIAGIAWVVLAKSLESESQQWIGLGLALAGLLGNVVVMLGKVGAIHDIFQSINSGHREVDGYCDLYQVLGQIRGDSKLIVQIRNASREGESNAIQGFAKLRRFVLMANLQRNALFYIPYLLLQLFFQWDFRVMELLERWQTKFGPESQKWLDALADAEALISSATVADEHRDWSVPNMIEQGNPIEATQLGHPLLRHDQRVGNDLTVDASHPLLLVTGSNMAGKSTLLRSLGLNLLLARTGAPVCAASFSSNVFELATSMRIQDSLQDGVSFFMAELHRLRDIVELARHEATRGVQRRPLLALLDEILQGTNSRERQIAVCHVVQQLIDVGVITAMSTHDLELADHPEIIEHAQIVHFREYFEMEDGQERMRFDYKMRPGPTPTTNALRLLEMVGLKKSAKS